MKCPVDGNVPQMTERHGVEVDYCPECRGVWLDHGELDRVADHAMAADKSRPAGGNDAKTRPKKKARVVPDRSHGWRG